MPAITSTVLYDTGSTIIVEGSDLPRIGAMLGILFVSLFAISFPGISKQTPSLRIPHLVFFIGKHFGTGAILSTAFCHLLPDAFESLQDRGVNERYHGIGKWTGMIILGSLLSIFLVEYISTSYVDHLHADPSAPPSPSSTRAPSPSPSRASIPPKPPTTQKYPPTTTTLPPSIPLHHSPNPPLGLPTPPTPPTPTETTPLVPKSHCTATHTHPHTHAHNHNTNHNHNHNHNPNNHNHNHNNHTHTHTHTPNDSEPLLPLFLLSSPRLFWKRSTPHFPAVLGWGRGRAAGDACVCVCERNHSGCVCERGHSGCVEEDGPGGGDEEGEGEGEGEGGGERERQREEGISEEVWVRGREGGPWEGDMDIGAREREEEEQEEEDDDERKSPKVGRRRQVVGILVLQLGIMIHSLVIGLTLAVTAGPEFTSLVTAIIFHQLFEGLSLGIRIASLPPPPPSPPAPPPSTPSHPSHPSPPSTPSPPLLDSPYVPPIPERSMPYPPRPTPPPTPHANITKSNKSNKFNKPNKYNKSWLTPVLAVLFAITTPAGMGLGSLVFDASASSGSVPEGDPEQAARIRLTQGIMSGVSAGMLIYAATVEMLAGDFVFGDVGGDVGVDWEGEGGMHLHEHEHDHFKHHHALHSNHSHHTHSLNHTEYHHHHNHHHEEDSESDTGTIDSIIIHARDLDHGSSKRRGAVWRKVVAVVSLLGGAGAMAVVGMGE